MSNHLGNVLAVVSDKTKAICNNDTVSYFTAEVLFVYDYSPFGAILPQRTYVADSTCTTVINYDTTYNSHYQVSFNVTTLLSPGQTIRLDNGAGTVKVLATYNAGYVTPFSYIAQILSNVSPAADGIQAVYAGGSTVTAYFSADSLGFDCGDVVTVYSGSTSLNTVSINCAVDSIFAVDTTIVCSSSDYRFGFNGKEKDNEVKGGGVSYDYGFRIYDSRLGKFLSIDPLSPKYPWYTPYQFAGNMPMAFVDLDGLEEIKFDMADLRKYSGQGHIDKKIASDAFNNVIEKGAIVMGIGIGVKLAAPLFTQLAYKAAPYITQAATNPSLQLGIWNLTSFTVNLFYEGPDDPLPDPGPGGEMGKLAQKIFKYTSNQLGKLGEYTLEALYKGTKKAFTLGDGAKRIVDVVEDAAHKIIAHESKVGYTVADSWIKQEFANDLKLLDEGKVDEVVWTFFKSPDTGKVGASGPLLEMFKAAQEAGYKIRTQILEISENAVQKVGPPAKEITK